MQHRKIMTVLIAILALACLIVGISLVILHHRNEELPAASVEHLLTVLEKERIRVDPALISTKRQTGRVYVCDSGDYNRTVAALLGGSEQKAAYVIPDGEIVLLKNGARIDFSRDFSFHYYQNGAPLSADTFDLEKQSATVSEQKREEICDTVTRFLDRGSRSFADAEKMNLETAVDTIWENDGIYYALCTRTIGGVGITDNTVLCVLRHGEVAEAYGTWSFLTSGETYSAQLADMVNILFNVKKQIAMQEHPDVTIESIESCYSLYSYGEHEALCLIPCWLIRTDTMGEFVYHAIDGISYTKD